MFRSTTLSRDGSKLAFLGIGGDGSCCTTHVRVLNPATGQLTSFPSTAGVIRWSPVSDSLAMIENDAVKIVAADGSGKRTISHPLITYFSYVWSWPVLAWSPDGKWVIAGALLPGGVQQMDLIEVATGRTMPLSYTHPYVFSATAPFWLE